VTRKFTKPIFFGNPMCEMQIHDLHDRLDEATVILGGLQQPAMATEKPGVWEEGRDEEKAELADCVRDIAIALDCKHLLWPPEIKEDPNVEDPEPFI
jgi:hypothetical protein